MRYRDLPRVLIWKGPISREYMGYGYMGHGPTALGLNFSEPPPPRGDWIWLLTDWVQSNRRLESPPSPTGNLARGSYNYRNFSNFLSPPRGGLDLVIDRQGAIMCHLIGVYGALRAGLEAWFGFI